MGVGIAMPMWILLLGAAFLVYWFFLKPRMAR